MILLVSLIGQLVNTAGITKAFNGMLESAQIRAARALLNWSQNDLARSSGVGSATVKRVELSQGAAKGNVSTFAKIKRAFERAGIRFIDADASGGIGVRLETTPTKGRRKRRA